MLELLVLGPQRSGTSMMARVLHHSGFDMGSPYVHCNEHQPQGFYESLGFSVFCRHAIIKRERNRERMKRGEDYVADAEDIVRLKSYLKFYSGRGYKHTFALALWDLFRQAIDRKCVVITVTRKKSDCMKSAERKYTPVQWKREKTQISRMYDKLIERVRHIEETWPNVVSVWFQDLVTQKGQKKIQEQFGRFFPHDKLDFSSVKPAIRESGGSNVYDETKTSEIITPERGVIGVRKMEKEKCRKN